MLCHIVGMFFGMYSAAARECFTCVSNPNWSYYTQRTNGLKNFNGTDHPTVAPLACILDPMKIYHDRTVIQCKGYCVKWTGVRITEDGSVEVNMMRGCFEKLFDSSLHSPPEAASCYQTPSHFNHRVGVEYSSTCFCKGYMCNLSSSLKMSLISLSLLFSIGF